MLSSLIGMRGHPFVGLENLNPLGSSARLHVQTNLLAQLFYYRLIYRFR